MRSRVICCVLTLLLLSSCTAGSVETLSADGETTTPISPVETEPVVVSEDAIVYLSLGDSIARGYGLADVEGERFSTIAKAYWQAHGIDEVTVYNAGVDGQDLWGVLDTVNEKADPAWFSADVVSISMGANHILSTVWSFLSTLSTGEVEDAAALCADFMDAVTEACTILDAGLPLLIENIHEMAPDATILFLTFYDPYGALPTEIVVGDSVVLVDSLIDAAVQQVNACIRGAVADYVEVVDVYAAFAEDTASLVCVEAPESCDPAAIDMGKMDPHPNAAGHKRIGELVGEAYLTVLAN